MAGTCQCGTTPPVPPLSFGVRHRITVCTVTSVASARGFKPLNFVMIVFAGSHLISKMYDKHTEMTIGYVRFS
jgi:hypothetical protein